MVRITSVQFQKNIGEYQDKALIEPITVTRNGRDRLVMLSVEEYDRLKKRDRQVLSATDLPASDIDAIRKLYKELVAQTSEQAE